MAESTEEAVEEQGSQETSTETTSKSDPVKEDTSTSQEPKESDKGAVDGVEVVKALQKPHNPDKAIQILQQRHSELKKGYSDLSDKFSELSETIKGSLAKKEDDDLLGGLADDDYVSGAQLKKLVSSLKRSKDDEKPQPQEKSKSANERTEATPDAVGIVKSMVSKEVQPYAEQVIELALPEVAEFKELNPNVSNAQLDKFSAMVIQSKAREVSDYLAKQPKNGDDTAKDEKDEKNATVGTQITESGAVPATKHSKDKPARFSSADAAMKWHLNQPGYKLTRTHE